MPGIPHYLQARGRQIGGLLLEHTIRIGDYQPSAFLTKGMVSLR